MLLNVDVKLIVYASEVSVTKHRNGGSQDMRFCSVLVV